MVRLNVSTTQEQHITTSHHHQLHYVNSNNYNSNIIHNAGSLNNSIPSPSSSTSSLNSNASSFEPHQHQHQLQHQLQHLIHQQHQPTPNIVMVVPQQQQQHAQQLQSGQQHLQYAHASAVSSQHQHQHQQPHVHHIHHTTATQPNTIGMAVHQHQQQHQQPSQQSPSEGSTSSHSASPPLHQQQQQQHTPTPPQSGQLVQPVCAVHHPQQHQQQLALVAAMHQHLAAAAGLGHPPPQHLHHAPGTHITAPQTQQHTTSPGSISAPQSQVQVQAVTVAAATSAVNAQQQQQASQHSQQNSNDNGQVSGCSTMNGVGGGSGSGPGISPSGSSSSGGGSTAASNTNNAIVAAAPPPPPQPAPGQLYIQYPGEFYPTEYYIAPHPHDGMCPQHHHHHQTLCAVPADYGPTTVQMVSQNRPAPIPVPVQVPQGQVMQQYVNENGPFAHVVLSPQYQPLHASQGHIHTPFLTANGTSHFYSPLPAGFPPGPGGGPAHFHALSSGHVQAQQPPQQQQAQASQPPPPPQQQQQQLQPLSHSPSPPNNYYKDERTQRQHTKLLRKLERQRELNSGMSTPTHSPSPRRNDVNGHQALAIGNNNSIINGPLNHNQSQNHSTPTSGILTSAATTSSSATSTINSNNNSLGGNQILQNINHNQYHVHQMQQQQSSIQPLNNHFQTRRNSQRNGNLPVNSHQLNNASGSGYNCITSSADTSEDGEEVITNTVEDEEDYQATIIEQLSFIKKPDVINLTSRSAKIIWDAPVITDPQINTRNLRYNVLFSDRAKDCKYKSLYKGDSYDCIVQDLQPGQVYVVRLQVHYEKLQGSASDPTEFTTPPCEPDQPMPPKLVMRTKNSLHLRWTNPLSNGSPIQHYLLEYDEGKTGLPATSRSARQNSGNDVLHFVEATKTKGKHYTLTKLQPSTIYNFRLAAVNDVGASLYSTICSYSTSSNPPSAPKPPKLQGSTSNSLRLWWERRQQDNDYVLQILDRESGHGYLNAYNGPDCVHECCQLRRATSYQFRLRAENEAGSSPWCSEVTFQTLPEKPGKPGKPHVKGKIHGTHFRARWDPPSDAGGGEILRYFLEITSGAKFERIYSGPDTEATCDRLQPGTTYQLRTSCEGPAGPSPYSDVAHITSEAIVPAAPPPPYYDNPPGPYAAVLRLDKPDYNGGAPVQEFEVQMRRPSDVQFDIENKTNEHLIVYRGREAYCVVKDLEPGCSYEVQVRAINRIGAGAWSSWFRFSAAAAPPSAPNNLKVVVKSSTHLFVNWQEPICNGAPILEYCLENATAQNDPDTVLDKSSTQELSYQSCYQGGQTSVDLRNLLPFTMYYFRVNAMNTAGVSKWSTNINAQTPAAVPSAPHIQDCEFTANEVTLNWTEPECNGAPITAYIIEYAEKSITTTDTKTTFTVTELMPETTYKFRLQAVNSIGAGPYSAYAKLTTLPSPPAPPALECTGVGHNFIKLKWGDGKNIDFTKYYVEMFVQRAKEYQVVYSGTNCMCKVNKLQERTAYTFRIYASTDRAGIGDYSKEYIFTTTPTLPSSIKAPRVAMEGAAACLLTHGAGAGAFIPSGMLPETPTSFIAGLGNLSLGIPLTLEWQNSKNTFNDRVEYILQYAIGKDGDFKQIYRGSETKFTIENLEPGAAYQFRVCPIRVTTAGEDLMGQYTSAFRYQVPPLTALDDIDTNLFGNMSNLFGNGAGVDNNSGSASMGCHGHSHMAHHVHTMHSHHSHNHPTHSHSHHNSRQSASSLHHRSVSASAASSNSCSSSANMNGNNSSNSSGGSTIVIGPNSIGLIPLGTAMANELAAVGFASCDDPLHHHHHHHHQFNGGGASTRIDSEGSTSTTASFLSATANSLLTNSALLTHGSASANHVQQHGAIRRCISKLTTLYTNRKRFTDQEKAVLFMVCFLFFTFLFATLVKALMR